MIILTTILLVAFIILFIIDCFCNITYQLVTRSMLIGLLIIQVINDIILKANTLTILFDLSLIWLWIYLYYQTKKKIKNILDQLK